MSDTLTAGDPVIDFELRDAAGAACSSLAARRHGLLLFAIYKKGCGTCRFTLPFLQRFHDTYAGPGFTFWGVSQDSVEETRQFAQENGFTFPTLVDDDLRVTEAYGLTVVPGIYLVDSSDEIVRHAPCFIKNELNEMARLVAERTGRPCVPVVRHEDDAPEMKPG